MVEKLKEGSKTKGPAGWRQQRRIPSGEPQRADTQNDPKTAGTAGTDDLPAFPFIRI